MRKPWTIGKKLTLGVGVLSVLLLASGVESLVTANSIEERLIEVGSGTAHRLALAEEVQAESFKLFGGEKIMIVAGFDNDRPLLDDWRVRTDRTYTDTLGLLDRLEALMPGAGRESVDRVRRPLLVWKGVHAEVVALIDSGRLHDAEVAANSKGRSLIEESEAQAERIVTEQKAALEHEMAAATAAFNRSWWTIVSLCVISLLVTAAVVVTVRGIVRALTDAAHALHIGVEQVTVASTQVATSAQSLSQGATEQAAALEETSASMEEMTSMTQQTAANVEQAATLVVGVTRQMQQSDAALEAMVASMNAIRESSDRVAKIIKAIDDIAFQTNILALNAAVEAARAGGAGAGFAVVADEVRNLAQRSAQAARDTAGLIEESIARSQEGGSRVAEVEQAIGSINGAMSQVRSIVDEVRSASEQQRQGIGQVAQAMVQVEQVTQTTASTAEESAAASEELNAQATSSMEVVETLSRMVGLTFEHDRAAAARPARRLRADVNSAVRMKAA